MSHRQTIWETRWLLAWFVFVILWVTVTTRCQEFVPQPVKYPVLHQGVWSTCGPDEERVLEHWEKSKFLWELHMGPRTEFALYDRQVDGEHSHDVPVNLLGKTYHQDDVLTWRQARQWNVRKLHLWLSIVRVPGSREYETHDDCYAYYVRVEHVD